MTRLTNDLRNAILRNAVAKTNFAKRLEDVQVQRARWAEKVRIEAIGGPDIDKRIKVLSKRYAKALDGIPASVCDNSGLFRVDNDICVNVAGRAFRAHFDGKTGYDRDTVVYRVAPSERYVLLPANPLVKEFDRIETVNDALQKEKDSLCRDIRTILESVKTIKRLLEVWPAAAELIPKESEPLPMNLPAVRVNKLNSALGIPSEKVRR